jgi:hypothetical protein
LEINTIEDEKQFFDKHARHIRLLCKII